jgi:hypothetical protein
LGGGWRWRGMGDAITKHLIWRGMATETLSGKPEKNGKKLADAVQDMFKHFPPKGGA